MRVTIEVEAPAARSVLVALRQAYSRLQLVQGATITDKEQGRARYRLTVVRVEFEERAP